MKPLLRRNDGLSTLLTMPGFNRKGMRRLYCLSDLEIATLVLFKPEDPCIWPNYVLEIQRLLSKIELMARNENVVKTERPLVTKKLAQMVGMLSCIKHLRDIGFDCLLARSVRALMMLDAGPALFEMLSDIKQAGPARVSRRTISIYSVIQFLELYRDELLKPPRLRTKQTFNESELYDIECCKLNWKDDDGESYLEAFRDLPLETFFDELPMLQPVLDWFVDTKPTFDKNQLKQGWRYLEKRSDVWHEQNQAGNYYDVIESDNSSWNCILAEYLASNNKVFPENSLYKIVPLTTPQLLLDEAQAMFHCVSSYIEYCIAGSSRIFSVRLADGDKRVATAELNLSDGEWKLVQLKGISNREFMHRMQSTFDPLAMALRELVAWYNQYGVG